MQPYKFLNTTLEVEHGGIEVHTSEDRFVRHKGFINDSLFFFMVVLRYVYLMEYLVKMKYEN